MNSQFKMYATESAFLVVLSKNQIDTLRVVEELSNRPDVSVSMKYIQPGHQASIRSLMHKGLLEFNLERGYSLSAAALLLIPLLKHIDAWPMVAEFNYAKRNNG